MHYSFIYFKNVRSCFIFFLTSESETFISIKPEMIFRLFVYHLDPHNDHKLSTHKINKEGKNGPESWRREYLREILRVNNAERQRWLKTNNLELILESLNDFFSAKSHRPTSILRNILTRPV